MDYANACSDSNCNWPHGIDIQIQFKDYPYDNSQKIVQWIKDLFREAIQMWTEPDGLAIKIRLADDAQEELRRNDE